MINTTEHNENQDVPLVSPLMKTVDEAGMEISAPPRSFQSLLRCSSAVAISMIIHAVILVTLGVLTVSSEVIALVNTIITR